MPPSIGYEVVAARGNFLSSHSYALAYSKPVLVTGMQADYKLNDSSNLLRRFPRGFQRVSGRERQTPFPRRIKWHNDEHKVSVSLMTDIGPQYEDPAFGPTDPPGQEQPV